jgi:hypothetical protein
MEASEGEYLVALQNDGILPGRILPSCQLEQTATPTHPPFSIAEISTKSLNLCQFWLNIILSAEWMAKCGGWVIS